MKTQFTSAVLTIVFVALFQLVSSGQARQKIDIRFLTAKFIDTTTTKNLDVVFLISTADTIDFPPTIILPPKCSVFENGREKVVLLAPQNLSVGFYAHDVSVKDETVYDLIKDIIDLKSFNDKNTLIACYSIKDLNYVFKKMSLTPAFTEKRYNDKRVEKRIEFDVK